MNEKDLLVGLSQLSFNIHLLQRWRDGHCIGTPDLDTDQVDILGVIDLHPGVIVSDLAVFLGMSLSTTLEKLKKLKDLKYVFQDESMGKRKLPLILTNSGKTKLAECRLKFIPYECRKKIARLDFRELPNTINNIKDTDRVIVGELLEPFLQAMLAS